MAAAAASSQPLQHFSKASFHNYLQTSMPLTNLRGPTDPRIPNASSDHQNISISCDNRLETNVYQTIENSLYMSMCTQNETIMKSVSEPLPSFLNSFNDIQNLKIIETSITEATRSFETDKSSKIQETSG